MDAVQRGLVEISEFVPDFAAGHAGRMEVYTYGPAGDEPRIVSYDFGVHEIDGADVSEWVDEGVSIVISITRRRRVETTSGALTDAARAPQPVGVTARAQPPSSQAGQAHREPEDRRVPVEDPSHDITTTSSTPYRSVQGVVPHMLLAPDVEG